MLPESVAGPGNEGGHRGGVGPAAHRQRLGGVALAFGHPKEVFRNQVAQGQTHLGVATGVLEADHVLDPGQSLQQARPVLLGPGIDEHTDVDRLGHVQAAAVGALLQTPAGARWKDQNGVGPRLLGIAGHSDGVAVAAAHPGHHRHFPVGPGHRRRDQRPMLFDVQAVELAQAPGNHDGHVLVETAGVIGHVAPQALRIQFEVAVKDGDHEVVHTLQGLNQILAVSSHSRPRRGLAGGHGTQGQGSGGQRQVLNKSSSAVFSHRMHPVT